MKLIIFWVNPFFVHHKSLDVRMSVGRLIGVGTFQNEKWNKTASLNRCLLPFLVFTLKKYLILIFITLLLWGSEVLAITWRVKRSIEMKNEKLYPFEDLEGIKSIWKVCFGFNSISFPVLNYLKENWWKWLNKRECRRRISMKCIPGVCNPAFLKCVVEARLTKLWKTPTLEGRYSLIFSAK